MPWKGPKKRYYYQSQWSKGRVMYTYVGGGLVGELTAQLDQLDQVQRRQAQAERQQQLARLKQETAPPAALLDHRRVVADLVRAALEAAGYRQHKRGEWRKRRMRELTDSTPTAADIRALVCAADAPGASRADRAALRRVLASAPEAGRSFDLYEQSLASLINGTHGSEDDLGKAIARGRAEALLSELLGPAPDVLERLQAQQIVLCDVHINAIQYQYGAVLSSGAASMEAIEFWDRCLTSAQARHRRAIEGLARIRRLLKLPALQFNVNMPGGQQVNVAGEVHHGGQ